MYYNPGKIIVNKENGFLNKLNRLVEYINNVTIPRQCVNRELAEFYNLTNGDVLEIGGYDRKFKSYVKKGKYLILDINASSVVDIVANAEKMPLKSESLGGVSCVSVLEHTLHPEKVVQEIWRCLKPGGYAYISVPWLFESHMQPYDYYRFSTYLLSNWTKDFKDIRITYANGYFGLLAHCSQKYFITKIFPGIPLFILHLLTKSHESYSIQINLLLKK